jgi:Domain of unknown function (DUF5069)
MPNKTNISAPDLTKRPPRSARLGGYAILPRMLDKGRAEIASTNGEFHYNCPLDQHIINFSESIPTLYASNSPREKVMVKFFSGSIPTRSTTARRGKLSNGATFSKGADPIATWKH